MTAAAQVLPKEKKLYYLNQVFTPGAVFANLKENLYDIVVGLDIGHGECMAYVYHKDSKGEWVAEPLVVTQSGDRYIPSYIAYIGGKPVIGSDATGIRGGLQVYFKREPSLWGKPSDDGAHTWGDLMEDYISLVWANILSKNEAVRDCEPQKVLIAIGCPASASWTAPENMKAYVSLAARATGYDHVTILPESTAAIMTPIYSGRQVDLHRGVAIYDLGSSTLDFTYILMGKLLLSASLPLGGSDIDQAMLRYVAKENERELGDANAFDLAPAHTKMRLAKERFYNTGGADQEEESLNISKALDFYVDDTFLRALLEEMGEDSQCDDLTHTMSFRSEDDKNKYMLRLILSSHDMEDIRISLKTRKEIYKTLQQAREDFLMTGKARAHKITVTITMDYALDKTMMNSVLWEDTHVSGSKLKAPYEDLSWGGCVTKFFERTRDSIGIRDLPCDTVVLTGGTSKVSAVREIAESYYPGKIVPEEDPSASVAKGLCLAKGHEVGAAEQLETIKTNLAIAMIPYYEKLCKGFARDCLFDRVWDKLSAATEKLYDGKDHTFEEFRKKIANYTANNPSFITSLKEDLRDYIAGFMDPSQWDGLLLPQPGEVIRGFANSLAKKVYQVEASSIPEVPSDLVASAARSMDESIVSSVIRESNIALYVQRIAVDFMYSQDQSLFSGITRVLDHIRVSFNTTLNAGECLSMYIAMAKEETKEKYRDKMGSKFSDVLKNSKPFRDAFNTLMEEQLEAAVGIVLFQIFEEYNG